MRIYCRLQPSEQQIERDLTVVVVRFIDRALDTDWSPIKDRGWIGDANIQIEYAAENLI